jgi:aspartyl-tRNA(Asn)/glutamyl-tRNA(Gln) amidotransferase subunit C
MVEKKSYWDVDEELVKRVAKVARIDLTENELNSFTVQIRSVLNAFRKIDEVDTSNVEPSFHPQPLSNDWREDEVEPWQWNPLENTKHKEGKNFKGPKIV